MLRLSDNPPILSPGTESLAELTGRWWVAHTKSRFEKAFAWDLARSDIGYFLPLVKRTVFSGGRKRQVMAPLFSSYVFFCGSDEDRYVAMTTNRLCQTIRVVDQERFVGEIAGIEKVIAGGLPLDPYPFAAVGRRCRIRSGPLQGTEGVVIQRGRPARLVLEVGILGQGASVEIDADLLEPAD